MNPQRRNLFILAGSGALLCATLAATFFGPLDSAPASAGAAEVGFAQPAATTAPAATSSQRLTASGASYTADAGTQLSYRLNLDMAVGMVATQPGAERARPFESQATGELQLTVVDRRAEEILVDWRLPNADIRVRGDETGATSGWSDALGAALRQGFSLRMDDRGCVRALRFDGTWSSDQRNWARALVSTLRFEVDAGEAWNATIRDAMGVHRFDYRGDRTSSVRSVTRRRASFVPHGLRASDRPDVFLRGASSAELNPGIGWLTAASIDEELQWTVPTVSMRFTSTLRGSLALATITHVDVAADWGGDWVDASGENEKSNAAQDQRDAEMDERLRGLDLPAALARIRTMFAAEQTATREYMELMWTVAEMVKRDPALAQRIAMLVQQGEVVGQQAADLLSTLGMAGHPEAQLALAAVFENGMIDETLRQAAVESMFQVAQPSTALVESLQRSMIGADRITPVRGTALLALGAFAALGAGSSSGRPLVGDILRLEGMARRDGQADLWTEALGNSGDPVVIEIAGRLLASADAIERTRALTMLRRVRSAAAHELLAGTARRDADAEVRRHAVNVIAETLDAWATELLAERATNDTEPEVRRAAMVGLGTRIRDDQLARTTLARLAGTERDADLVELLTQLRQEA